MITIEVNVKDETSGSLRDLLDTLTGQGLADLNAVGGRYAVNAASEFHREFEQGGGWRGNRYMRSTAPGVKSGDFGANIAKGWFSKSSDADGATISNNAEHYGFRIRGGTITPKRVSALTRPLIPEAKGIYARTYQENTGRRLFRPKGTNVLMERVEGQVTGSRGRRGQAGAGSIRTNGLRAVYALVKSVTLPPFPEGLPPEEMLADEFTIGWLQALRDKSDMI